MYDTKDSGKRKELWLTIEEFIPNDEDKREVNHISGDKSNNSVSNLEWSSPSENVRHANSTGLMGGLQASDILAIRHLSKTTDLNQREIGLQFGVKPNTINQILNKKRWGWL